MKRLLIIDGLHNFYRAWIKNPSVTPNGTPIGGVVGTLRILQSLFDKIKPTKVVFVWDGGDGSVRRRQIDSNYKNGRKPSRLNRQFNLTEAEEQNGKNYQQLRLIEYLNNLPIIQLLEDGTEADDVISYISQLAEFEDYQKIIVSSDKDFYQLCNNNTVIYRPIKDVFVNTKKLIEEYGIHPTNFALARAICGDKSDNLPGIKGAGLKTIGKRFDFLSEDKYYNLTHVFDYAKLRSVEEETKHLKIYHEILENEDIIDKNYRLMQLYVPTISVQSKMSIKHILNNAELNFAKFSVQKLMIEDGFVGNDWSGLFTYCNKLCADLNH